jgi:hypothetical protein
MGCKLEQKDDMISLGVMGKVMLNKAYEKEWPHIADITNPSLVK